MRLFAWALYDLANTFFAVAMLSFFFPLWVVEDRGAKELTFSLALGVSMCLVALAMPVCGAISDATGYRMRYLRRSTLVCVACTAAIGFVDRLDLALAFFIVANVAYQLGTIFYDAMLRDLATRERLGAASGFGAAFGYLGSMTGLAFLWPFVQRGGHHAAFVPAAVFFLLFALPSFLIFKETGRDHQGSWIELAKEGVRRLLCTLKAARQHAGLWRLFIASFFSSSAINTVLIFMAVYTKQELHFTEERVIRFFLWGQAFAVAGALGFGWIVGRLGPKRTLGWIWTGWIAALLLVGCSPDPSWLWVAGPAIGFCLGSTWSTSRVLLIELAPPQELAEFLGLAGFLGRASSIFGPLLWGLIVVEPGRYRHAVFALIGLLVIGLWLFRGVPDPSAAKTS